MAKISLGQENQLLVLSSDTPTLEIEKMPQCQISIFAKNSRERCPELTMESFHIYHIEDNLNFTSLIEDLDSQISIYNQEISLKENSLVERERIITLQEKQVKRMLNDIELMNLSLDASKNELQDLKADIFPALEFQSELIKELIHELQCKKEDIEMYLENLKTSRTSVGQKGAMQNAEKLQEEAEKKYKENCEFADYLLGIQQKLDLYYDNKNKELKENGEQLAKLQENIDCTIELINKKEKELFIYGESLREKGRYYHHHHNSENQKGFNDSTDSLRQAPDKRKSKLVRAECLFLSP